MIINDMKMGKIDKDEVLFHKGKKGVYFYVVKEGTLALIVDGKIVRTFSKGDSFGELALLHDGTRTGTIVAHSKASLFCLHKREFKKTNDFINRMDIEENLKFINSISYLSNLFTFTFIRLL